MSSLEGQGGLARGALRRGGVVSLVAKLDASTYYSVGGTLVWVGRPGAAMHPRAVARHGAPTIDRVEPVERPWRPARVVLSGGRRELEQRFFEVLAADIGEPRGFGTMLFGGAPQAPFDLALARIRRFAATCDRDDAADAVSAGAALLGLGPGLTPSGDDFVGGALFAKRALVAGGNAPEAWKSACRSLAALARRRTTRISAALFGDLASGRSFAPLHDLTEALDRGDARAAASAARRLVAIGHSSGWDMLAGHGVGLLGSKAITGRRK